MFFGHSFLLMVPSAAFNPAVCFSSTITTTRNFVPVSTLHDTVKLVATDSAAAKTVAPDSITIKKAVAKITLNKHVAGFVKSYIKKEDEFLQKMKGKSVKYFKTIEKVFNQHGIPQQLKYLAIVESELHSNAKSGAGARGLWQLMPVTAKELGLRLSGKTDERTHTYRSTVAAAKYLRSLYADFGDWLLVLAAYNSGPGTVYKAIKKAGSRNFWALQKYLPAESRGHVKRFIGIHFFFEGEGSITTQTKAEAAAWQAALEDEVATK